MQKNLSTVDIFVWGRAGVMGRLGKLGGIKSRKLRLLILTAAFVVIVLVLVGCVSRTPPQRPAVSPLGTTTTLAKYISGADVVVEVAWTPESKCASCHDTEVASTTNECLAAKHPDTTCIDCHSDNTALTNAHVDLVHALREKPPKSLELTNVPEALCISCHDLLEISQATVGVLVDEEGGRFNPHNIPPSESHSEITCNDCHKMHDTKPALQASADSCGSCHHEGIYRACITCHE